MKQFEDAMKKFEGKAESEGPTDRQDLNETEHKKLISEVNTGFKAVGELAKKYHKQTIVTDTKSKNGLGPDIKELDIIADLGVKVKE